MRLCMLAVVAAALAGCSAWAQAPPEQAQALESFDWSNLAVVVTGVLTLLSGQRYLPTKIDHGSLDPLASKIAALEAKVDALSAKISGHDSTVSIAGLSAKVDELAKRLDRHSTNNTVQSLVLEVEALIQELKRGHVG